MQKVFWKGISSDDRIKAISEITTIVDKYGTILNFQKFSDLVLSLVVEIESSRLRPLHISLKDVVQINVFDKKVTDFPGESILFLNITFIKGTGDLEIEIQDIPE